MMPFLRHHCRLLTLFHLRQLQLRPHRRHRRDLLEIFRCRQCCLVMGLQMVCFQYRPYRQTRHLHPNRHFRREQQEQRLLLQIHHLRW